MPNLGSSRAMAAATFANVGSKALASRVGSDTLELDQQSLVRISTSVDALGSVAEADHDTPTLEQVAQGRNRWVGGIAGNRELRDRAIEERHDDLVIGLRVTGTTGKEGGQ